MLGVVSSNIDEIEMDELTYFRIHSKQKWLSDVDQASDVEVDFFNIIELDTDLQSLLMQVDSKRDRNFIGFQIPSINFSIIKSLAFFYQTKQTFHKLAQEVLNHEISGVKTTQGRMAFEDVIDCLDANHIFGIIISSNLEEYKNLQKLNYVLTNQHVFKHHQKDSQGEVEAAGLSLDTHKIITTDDKKAYKNEILGNLSKYYFQPYLDDTIPYKPSYRREV